MANFVVIVDPDSARRQAFIRQAAQRLAPVDGLEMGRLEVGDFSAIWAASPRAPVDVHTEARSAAVLWGHALGPRDPATAQELASQWLDGSSAGPPPFDGYHAGAAFRQDRGLTIGADLLGMFPIYYAASLDVCIASATPEPFRYHPRFPSAIDVDGLVGLLVARAPLGGRTLLRGVSRLSAAHALVWRPASGHTEVRQYRIPVTDVQTASRFRDDVAALDEALAIAALRHTRHAASTGVLLSGGRDSRMWAGYLAERGAPLHMLTLGEPGDFEVECATSVAATLGTTHDIVSIDESRYPWAAGVQARHEHLIGGFGNIYMWGLVEPLRRLPDTLVTGYLTDSVITGKSITPGLHEFDVAFPRLAHLAIAPEQLRRLLRRDVAASAVDDTVQRFRRVWEATAPPTQQRAWQFQLAHSERCHVGAIPWRLAFGSWPVIPVLDRRVLDTVGALPAQSLANRRAQDTILRQRFPRLARLPYVAANGDIADPLLPPLSTRLSRFAERLTRQRWTRRAAPPTPAGQRERRFNYRMYDFNSPGWRAIRRAAEPERERLASLFDMDALREFLPPPEATLAVNHAIFDSVGRKLIVGLMLWSREHLS
jgi:asparagine synthase (glutamine-hydrolysing)